MYFPIRHSIGYDARSSPTHYAIQRIEQNIGSQYHLKTYNYLQQGSPPGIYPSPASL